MAPSRLMAEIIWIEVRVPVLRTMGVLPIEPQVMPQWQSLRTPASSAKSTIRHPLAVHRYRLHAIPFQLLAAVGENRAGFKFCAHLGILLELA